MSVSKLFKDAIGWVAAGGPQVAGLPAYSTDSNGTVDLSGGSQGSIPLNQLRQFEKQNLSKGALVQAPAWAALTNYVIGQKVRLNSAAAIAAGTSGMLFVCNVAGTSGATEPAYAITGAITDGGVTWYALDRYTKLNVDGYKVPVITGTATAPTGSFLIHAYWNKSQFYSANTPTLADGPAGAYVSAQYCLQKASGNPVSVQSQIEFVTDDPNPAIAYWASGSANFQPVVYVDDYLLEESPTLLTANNPSYYSINWGGVRKLRRYRVSYAGANLQGVRVQPNSIFYAAPPAGLRACYFSDSVGILTQPIAMSPPFGAQTSLEAMSYAVPYRLGYRTIIPCPLPSTGYDTNGTYGYYTPSQVLTNYPITSFNPDLVIFAQGINDVSSGNTTAATMAAALATWQLARTQAPNALIVVLGPWMGSASVHTLSSINAFDTALNTQFAAWGDVNSVYVSLTQNPNIPGNGAIISGSGEWTSVATGVATLTANISNGTSGTLTASYAGVTGTYEIGFTGHYATDSNQGSGLVTATLTNGSTSVAFSQAITTTSTSITYSSGNSDFYIYSDGTHPTVPGFEYATNAIVNLIDQALMLRNR